MSVYVTVAEPVQGAPRQSCPVELPQSTEFAMELLLLEKNATP